MGRGLSMAGQWMGEKGCGLNTDMNNRQKRDAIYKFEYFLSNNMKNNVLSCTL